MKLRTCLPSLVTVLGLALGLAGLVAFEGGQLALALVLLFAGQLCDLVDGMLARHLGVVTTFGAKLDYVTDLVLTCGALWLGPLWLAALVVFAAVPLWAWQLAEPRAVRVSGRVFATGALGALSLWRLCL